MKMVIVLLVAAALLSSSGVDSLPHGTRQRRDLQEKAVMQLFSYYCENIDPENPKCQGQLKEAEKIALQNLMMIAEIQRFNNKLGWMKVLFRDTGPFTEFCLYGRSPHGWTAEDVCPLPGCPGCIKKK